MKKIIPIAIIGLAALFYFLIQEKKDLRPVFSGNIEVTEVDVSFRIPGQIVSLSVEEGNSIEIGQTIARLDDSEISKEIAVRNADIRQAQGRLLELSNGFLTGEITSAEETVKALEFKLNQASQDLSRMKKLYAKQGVAEREYENAATAYKVLTAQKADAVSRLQTMKNGPRAEQIEQARAACEKAQKALEQTELKLSFTKLAAPISGIVERKFVETGENVNTGSPVVSLLDFSDTWARVYIPETMLGKVRLGQEMLIRCDSYPGKVFQGTVAYISPSAEFTPKSIQTQEERVKLVFRIKVKIPNQGQELKPGMPVDVEFSPDRR
ncbi:MAG: efflux RND transporter periplasmic adaptor subunit [Candidatus Wallbacteria bacterium]|nr:efflux RND transporter periplasmic adaptor subunit [Candidatus Wallbacteria bacterium]